MIQEQKDWQTTTPKNKTFKVHPVYLCLFLLTSGDVLKCNIVCETFFIFYWILILKKKLPRGGRVFISSFLVGYKKNDYPFLLLTNYSIVCMCVFLFYFFIQRNYSYFIISLINDPKQKYSNFFGINLENRWHQESWWENVFKRL